MSDEKIQNSNPKNSNFILVVAQFDCHNSPMKLWQSLKRSFRYHRMASHDNQSSVSAILKTHSGMVEARAAQTPADVHTFEPIQAQFFSLIQKIHFLPKSSPVGHIEITSAYSEFSSLELPFCKAFASAVSKSLKVS